MKTCFLTSNPLGTDFRSLNPANGFAEQLTAAVPAKSRALYICSDPDSPEETDRYAYGMKASLKASGFRFSKYAVLDKRNQADAAQLIGQSDFIILAGGHVPTQNRFFTELHLKDMLDPYEGVILGISAGSMNSADVVYVQPELPGEAANRNFQKFLSGLNLTGITILPHYQICKDEVVDGVRVYEEITYPDSLGRKFYAIPDGSYFLIRGRDTELHGEAYLIQDGGIRQISAAGDCIQL
jgi:peptidase E